MRARNVSISFNSVNSHLPQSETHLHLYRNQLEHGINNETQKAIKAVADAHLKFNEDKKKMEEEFAAKMRTLENRVAALGKNNRQNNFYSFLPLPRGRFLAFMITYIK